MTANHKDEVDSGERFEFGANWSRFLRILNDDRIRSAEHSLCEKLGVSSLAGMRFLDAGSGSGLFSLAARRLGATVYSFDYDPQSVACTRALKARYMPDDAGWVIQEASVLDTTHLASLGQFDVVYSWGVLHHTGSMWSALENVSPMVAPKGKLFMALYNDQGWISKYWSLVKQCYGRNALLRWLMLLFHAPYLFGMRFVVRSVTGRLDIERGMSLWYDMIDWIGGYPFEVAAPDEIRSFYESRSFRLTALQTCGTRHGCNEFVFSRLPA